MSLSDVDFLKNYLRAKGIYVVVDDFDFIDVVKMYIEEYGYDYVKSLIKKAVYKVSRSSRK